MVLNIEDEKEIRESITKGTLKNISNDRIVSELYNIAYVPKRIGENL